MGIEYFEGGDYCLLEDNGPESWDLVVAGGKTLFGSSTDFAFAVSTRGRIAVSTGRGFATLAHGKLHSVARRPSGVDGIAWSPDGNELVVASDDGLEVLNARTGVARRITAQGREPAWSATDLIAYVDTFLAAGNMAYHGRLRVTQAAGGRGRVLDNYPWDIQPAWSPNGKLVAFARKVGHGAGIYVMTARGTHKRRLTTAPKTFSDAWPTWSPDGRWIAYSRGGDEHLVSVDGKRTRSLAPLASGLAGSVWVPAKARLAATAHAADSIC